MAEFELSNGINASKVFLAHRSELIERFDPEMVLYNKKIKRFSYLTKPLKSLLLNSPQYGANESGITRGNNMAPRYVRITDIDENGNLINGLGVTAEVIEKRYILNNDDLLIARSGNTVGKTYLHKSDAVPYDCFFAGYMIRFVVDPTKILPDYFFLYTQLTPYKDWVKAIKRAAGQPNINAEEYKSLQIPLPNLNIQNDWVLRYQQAEQKKKQKEKQAQTLLEGIDSYLLAELGITLPEQDNRLEKRIFTVPFHKVTGRRLDAPVQRSSFSLLSSKYPMARLIKEFEFNPNTNITSQFCSFIPMEKISDTEGVVVSSKETLFKDDAAGYTRFAENDLLWARITPCMQNGKSAVATNLVNGFGYGSTEYFVFRESNGNNIHYLHALLRTKYVRNAAIFYFGGATGHQRVSLDFFNSMTIPLPPLEKQNEISTHIIDIRAQAKQLQQEASQILAEAKTEIERMILGEDA